MKKTLLILTALIACLCAPAYAALELPVGLSFDPTAGLDLTYQIIPAYDEKEMVIASWADEKLQYFVGVDKLPPDATDAKSYFDGLVKDLRARWGTVESGKMTAYRTASGLSGSAMVLTKPSANAQSAKRPMVVHFITDGTQSFYAIGTPVGATTIERVVNDTLSLMKTARLSEVGGRVEPAKDDLFGTWVGEEKLADGRLMLSTIQFKPDGTFTMNLHTGNGKLFSATGKWSRKGDKLNWEYLQSTPALPSGKRKETDRILSFQPETMELQSSRSGKTHVFQKAMSR